MSGNPKFEGKWCFKVPHYSVTCLLIIFDLQKLLKDFAKLLIKPNFHCKELQFSYEKHFSTKTKYIILGEKKRSKDHIFKLFWDKKESCCKYFGVLSGKGTGENGFFLSETSISNDSGPTLEQTYGIKYAIMKRKNTVAKLEWRTKHRASYRIDVF